MEENKGSVEPIVLGKLKKQKTSKPAFVIISLAILIGVCLGLPAINDYLKKSGLPFVDYINSFFNKVDGEDKIIITKESIITLTEKAVINYDMIELSEISVKGDTVSFTIKTRMNNLNLDDDTMYLEIYNSTKTLVRRVKLMGIITSAPEKRTVVFADAKFNAPTNYLGRMYRMTDEEYDKVSFGSPVANLTCSNANHTYTFTFNSLALKMVNHRYTLLDTSNMELYLEKLSYYNGASKVIEKLPGCTASAAETAQGLEYKAKIDLAKVTKEDLKDYADYNYYVLDKPAKIVKYEMKAQGYVCK